MVVKSITTANCVLGDEVKHLLYLIFNSIKAVH